MQAPISLLHQLSDLNIPQYPSVTGLRQPVSVESLAGFFWALVWGGVLLLSFTGWGRFAGRAFRVRRLPASVACTVGIAVIIFFGGLLNLLNAIYALVIFVLVAIGLLLYIVLRKERPEAYRWKSFWRQSSLAGRLLVIAMLLLLFFRVIGTIRSGKLNSLDDGPGYLTFPHKMLEVHSFASDPFSERRVTTSLGGGYFLQSFIVSATSLANIAMADRALGLVLLGGMLFDLGILFELSTLQIAWLELLAFLVPQGTMNLTFVILPVSILLGMIWMTWLAIKEEGPNSLGYALLAGFIGGTAISLKSTYLPCVGTFALIPYVLLFGRRKPKLAIQLPVFAGLGVLIVLCSWMIAMKLTSGTYLFPVLGRGIDYSGYGLFQSVQKFHSTRRFAKIFLQAAALLALVGIQLFAGRGREGGAYPQHKRRWFSAAILIAAAIAITAINYETGGDSIWRYNFPQFFSVVLLYYVVAASMLCIHAETEAGHGMARVVFYAGVLSLVAMMFYYDVAGKDPRPFRQVRMEWSDYQPSLRAGLTGLHLASPRIQAEYRTVEDLLPQHATVLENVAYPFLFNYRNHKIFIADWPGAATPFPGWRFRGSSSSFSNYLLSNSIRYIVYDYNYGRWMDVEGCEAIESSDLNSEWLKEQWWLSILTHNQFDHLQARYRSIYDDGNIVVIDLGQPIANAPPDGPVWTLDTNKDEMCSEVTAQYLKNPLPD